MSGQPAAAPLSVAGESAGAPAEEPVASAASAGDATQAGAERFDDGPSPAQWAAAVAAIRSLPLDAPVLLACHVNPDGDALGSMLGFGLGLRSLGFTRLQASFPGPMELPEPFATLPGRELLVPAEETVREPALLMSFDAASVSRLGELADRIRTAKLTVVLDHHASYTGFGTVHLVDPRAAATSVVAEALLSRLGVKLDARIAECLYVALVTDTGSFKFDMTTPAVHHLAARLLATGIRPADIARRVFDSRPFGAVRLYGDVLSRVQLEPEAAKGRGLAWTWATLDDLSRHDQRPYVLEPLIDSVRCIAEADVSCVVKQVAAREWAVSMRSKGATDVGAVAVALGGGGHRLAAGFTGYGDVEDVMRAIREQLDA